jgi:1-phosphatidylinositol-4-phosphate 5-kinase
MPVSRRRNNHPKGVKSPEAIAMRRAIGSGAPTSSNITLPDVNACTDDREHFLFYQDEGGLRATGDENENLDTIYYLGIIDILTPWTLFKKVEHLWKGMNADRVSGNS